VIVSGPKWQKWTSADADSASSCSGAVAIERFTLEASRGSRLDPPYAVHVYALGTEDDGLLRIAMELVHDT
jgi:hypothetical protein